LDVRANSFNSQHGRDFANGLSTFCINSMNFWLISAGNGFGIFLRDLVEFPNVKTSEIPHLGLNLYPLVI
jgi:hypothetical protein